MKLGFWNRLVIVVAGITLLVGPPTIQLAMAHDAKQANDAAFEVCKLLAEQQPIIGSQLASREDCIAEYLADDAASDIWTLDTWLGIAAAIGGACAILYVILFALQRIARWVWQGRE